jgi:molybdate transport system substrate-binding protein
MILYQRVFTLFAFALAASSLLASGRVIASPVSVYAAASTKDALDAIAQAFTEQSKVETRRVYAGSNALAQQIANGAPASIFISADDAWMDFVHQRGLLVDGTRQNLLSNELVLIAPATSSTRILIENEFPLAQWLGRDRLAVANPDTVPAGKYAKAALTSLGVWKSVENKLARAENVRAALTYVVRGETPFGVVYRSDALLEPRVRIVASFPKSTHADINYPVAIVRTNDSADARRFMSFLSSDTAKAIWRKFGFEVGVTKK